MMVRQSCLALACIGLAACAMPSSHHAADARGGYSETQVDRAVFRVTYRGNVAQKQGETDELALLRSAEVAQSHGYGFFTSGGAAATGTALTLFAATIAVPSTTLTIVCYPMRPETDGLVYEADAVIATLGAKYRRP